MQEVEVKQWSGELEALHGPIAPRFCRAATGRGAKKGGAVAGLVELTAADVRRLLIR